MKAYKGFNPDMTCRGFQYEEGKTYETDKAELCECGFHACLAPLDVISYYPFVSDGKMNRFHEVELEEVSERRARDDTKVVARRIKIGAELNLLGLIKAQFEYVKANTTTENTDLKSASAGDWGAASAGDWGAASAGERGAASAGERGAASAGDWGASTSRGNSSVGRNGIACARGNGCKVKGGMGAVLVIAEENTTDFDIKSWKAFVVDGENYKPDVWYTLKDGKVVEVTE